MDEIRSILTSTQERANTKEGHAVELGKMEQKSIWKVTFWIVGCMYHY